MTLPAAVYVVGLALLARVSPGAWAALTVSVSEALLLVPSGSVAPAGAATVARVGDAARGGGHVGGHAEPVGLAGGEGGQGERAALELGHRGRGHALARRRGAGHAGLGQAGHGRVGQDRAA